MTNETLNYLVYKEFLVKLGFISERYLASPEQDNETNDTERNIVFDLWKHLGGQLKNHVTLNNFRIFLLAIMGTFVEPGLNREEQNLQKIAENGYGTFND